MTASLETTRRGRTDGTGNTELGPLARITGQAALAISVPLVFGGAPFSVRRPTSRRGGSGGSPRPQRAGAPTPYPIPVAACGFLAYVGVTILWTIDSEATTHRLVEHLVVAAAGVLICALLEVRHTVMALLISGRIVLSLSVIAVVISPSSRTPRRADGAPPLGGLARALRSQERPRAVPRAHPRAGAHRRPEPTSALLQPPRSRRPSRRITIGHGARRRVLGRSDVPVDHPTLALQPANGRGVRPALGRGRHRPSPWP